MSIHSLENFDLRENIYSLQDKLWQHVEKRSGECFERAEKVREAISNPEELSQYIKKQREDFIKSLGGIPYDKTLPLNSKTTGVTEEDGLTIENIIFESRPNVYVTANLYIPKKRKDPCPAVLFQVGHAIKGRMYSQYQRVARTIASFGLIVLAIDPVGQGERLSYYEPLLGKEMIPATTSDHQYAGEQCVLCGDSIARYFIADAMRAIDYLETRKEVDNEKIGATGSSGGGTATCHMMLCDERIKAAAPGTFVTTREDYLYAGGPQDSEQIWHGATQRGFDHQDFLLSFAPKPALILAVESDFFPIEGARKTLEAAKRFYGMFGKEENIKISADESMHSYTDNLALYAGEFFARVLCGENARRDESISAEALPEEKLCATKSGQVSIDFPDAQFVYQENLKRLKESDVPFLPKKDFILEKVNMYRKEVPLALRKFSVFNERGLNVVPYMWFSQERMPNYGLLFSAFDKKPKEVVICLWDKGTDSLEEHIYSIRKICDDNKAAFVIDLSGMGKCKPYLLDTTFSSKEQFGVLNKLTKDLFFLGDSLCALRVFELRYLIKNVCKKLELIPSLYAEGVCGAYARLYGEIDEEIKVSLHAPVPDYDELVSRKYYEDYNIAGALLPGIAKYYTKRDF